MSDRAFLCGINRYPGNELNGCVNDIQDMANFLVDKLNFSHDSIRMLTDERATTTEIMARLHWLVMDAQPGDRLVFHFSGHGVQLPARNDKGEVDKLDECIVPVDFNWDEHVIRDDDFVALFSTLPKGVNFYWISDSCHSGDLSRDFLSYKTKSLPLPADIAWRMKTAEIKAIKPKPRPELPLVYISGCKSTQTSADAVFGNRPNGALTYYLLQALEAPGALQLPMSTIVSNVRKALHHARYSQVPQLEGTTSDFDLPFLGIK